jgi:hypothetical protein
MPRVNGHAHIDRRVSLSGNRRLCCRTSHATQKPETRTPTARHLSSSERRVPRCHVTFFLVRSGIAGSRFHRSQFSCITKPRTPILRCHVSTSSGEAYFLTPVFPLFYRDFVIREFAPPEAQGHRPCRTPNPDSSRSSATCLPGDRRLQLTREIAGRDFKEYKTLTSGNAERRTPIQRDPAPRVLVQINGADLFGESQFAILRGVNPRLVNPRMPIPRDPMGFDPSSLVLTAISHAALPRSDGPRDFGPLLGNSKSSILFLWRIFHSTTFALCDFTGVCTHSDSRIFFRVYF